MSKEEKNVVSMAKKYIAKDLGADEKDIAQLRNNAEADELINYLRDKIAAERKENEKSDEKKENKKVELKENLGTDPNKIGDLPEAERLNDKLKYNLRDALNPLSIRRAQNSRYQKRARILPLFTEDNPEGRVF